MPRDDHPPHRRGYEWDTQARRQAPLGLDQQRVGRRAELGLAGGDVHGRGARILNVLRPSVGGAGGCGEKKRCGIQ
jgi:hypothetical protein